ncbi:MAG TPA: hypothetical protein QF624_11645 [Dehalococcoidia bacterium]|jgi:tRNA nucleotidyltransferase (CCA-adding enzyme)|nr:hypothetical protein [Dehalococcoidia bacterium]
MHPSINAILPSLPSQSRLLLDAAVATAEARGEALWLVGGAVRDYAAGLSVRNVDVSVDGDAAALATEIAESLDVTVQHFPRFATATVSHNDAAIDIAALRSERYARDGALPDVRLRATLERDLARRDFTVNAIAIGLTAANRDELVDPFDGLTDLADRRLRVLHNRAFADDATRLWRGARYAARLRLRPDRATAVLIADGTRSLTHISGRRLWAEFVRTAADRGAYRTLRQLDRWGVLAATAPALALSPPAVRALRHRPGPHNPTLLLAVLVGGSTGHEDALDRFAVSGEVRSVVEQAAALLAAGKPAPELLTTLEGYDARARLAALWFAPGPQRPLQRELRRWERTHSPLDAGALGRLGVAAGPAIGETLRRLRRERYLGTLSSAAEARRSVQTALCGTTRRGKRG